MSLPLGRFPVVAVLVLLAAGALYATRLAHAPIYLTHDEANFSLQAMSIADSGRDLNGRLLPVYFSEPEFPAGRDPLMIYVTALGLQVLPLSDASMRIPTALVGVATIALLLFLTARIAPLPVAAIAAVMLMLTPGWFIHSRLALSVIYPVPFVIAWLIALCEYTYRPRPWLLAAGTASLGLGIYGYLAGVIMMPLYVVMTVWLTRAWREPRTLAWIAGGFAGALLPMLLWHVAHPERIAQLMTAYRVDDPAATTPPLLSWLGVRARLDAWWQYFNPDFLFLSGDSSLTNSTRTAGLFPMAFAILMPIGAWRLLRGSRFDRLLVLGLLTGPLAAVATGSIHLNRYRAMFVIPFAVLVAVYGVDAWWDTGSRWRRAIVLLLVASIPIQFAGFYGDYMGRYRDASSVWFGKNIRAALAVVYDPAVPPAPVMISSRIPYGEVYARYYSRVIGARPQPEAPMIVDGATLDVATAPSPGWLVAAAGEPWLSRLDRPDWERVATISEPFGDTSFVVYRRRAR